MARRGMRMSNPMQQRYHLESTNDPETKELIVKVYDYERNQSFVYYKTEIVGGLPPEIGDIGVFLMVNWEDIEKGLYHVDEFSHPEIM